MKKFLLSLFLLVFTHLIFCHAQQKNLIIKGSIKGDHKGYTKIYCYGDGIPEELSQEIRNGEFEFSLPFEKPIYLFFCTEFDIKTKGGYQPFGILVDQPGIISVSVDDIEAGFKNARVSGLQTAELYQSLNNEKKVIYLKISEIIKTQYGKEWVPDSDPLYKSVIKTRDSLMICMFYPFIEKWIDEHLSSYASVFELNNCKEAIDVDVLVKEFRKLGSNLQHSDPGVSISDYIHGVQNSRIGGMATDFTLLSHEGTPFSLSKTKGKYVILDFWASWCGPCRESFPHMREVYSKLKDKNVVFVNISIDKNKDAWLKAVAKENNPWIQLLDNQNIGLRLFGVVSIPTTFLISPEGNILLKEVGFDSTGSGRIESKLKELFLVN